MKLRSTLRSSPFAGLLALGVAALGVTSCGDDEQQIVTTLDAGNPLSPTDTSAASSAPEPTSGSLTVEEGTVPAPGTTDSRATDNSNASTSADESLASTGTELSAASTAQEVSSTGPAFGETSSEPGAGETTEVVVPCGIAPFSVFSRSDTDASWDDNDFSDVLIDSSQCPPAVYVDTTWPHEEGWANGDPSEANQEQVHFTLDSYGATNLVDKEITATVELVADERGPDANAGGYLVSIVSVSTFDRITVIPPVVVADAGPDAATPEPQILTETGYSEAESALNDRILLRRVGDRATVSFRLPAKTEAVDSYDPARVLKINLRFYNVFEGQTPVDPGPIVDAGSVFGTEPAVDASADAGVGAAPDSTASLNRVAPAGDPSLVYDYRTSRFAISKFEISDVPAATAP
jgi:hypothetical protein